MSLVTPTIEPFCWLVVFLISAFFIAKYASGKYFLHGLVLGILNSIWITAVHVMLYEHYVAGHPDYMEMMAGLPPDLAAHPRRMMLPINLIIGLLSGVVLGVFAFIAGRIARRKSIT